jgi:hypothetical protein
VRKFAPILLLTCLFIYESGYLFLYCIQQYQIKTEIKAYIRSHPAEQGTQFSFKMVNGKIQEHNFNWLNENDEFSFSGELYDVISIKETNGSITIHAINDEDESQLIAAYNKHQQQKQNTSLTQLLTLIFIPQETDLNIAAPVFHCKLEVNRLPSSLTNVPLPVLILPPDIV